MSERAENAAAIPSCQSAKATLSAVLPLTETRQR
jgi:hypothetical protein